MPCQVSWQSVAIKPQASVTGLGAEAAAAGGALNGMMSAARRSTAHEAPATARSIAVEIPIFVIRKPRDRNHCEHFPHHDDFDLIPVGPTSYVWYFMPTSDEKTHPVAVAPH